MQRAFLTALLMSSLVFAGCISDDDTTNEGSSDDPVVDRPTYVDVANLPEDAVVFDVLDANGEFLREAAWRVVETTGNCCEEYVTTDADGTIYEFGGHFIHVSHDEGVTWDIIETPLPQQNGEGAIVPAPGGDIVAIGWDPYSGDHAYGMKYEADTDEWLWAPAPIHTPFWDRQWIVAIPGPFTIDGETVEYVTFARGGTGYKEALLMAKDGLTYHAVSLADVETILASGPTSMAAIDVEPDPERDWMQPQQETRITAVGTGFGIQTVAGYTGPNDEGDCSRVFDADGAWSCLELTEATLPGGPLLVDSTGGLHVIQTNRTGFTYHISHDGGRNWMEQGFTLPHNRTLVNMDFKAHAALDTTVVAIHAEFDTDRGQEYVYRFSGLNGAPQLEEILVLGDGKAESGRGGAGSQTDRFDFMTLSLLPDGRIVTVMQDSRYEDDNVRVSSNQLSTISPVLVIELDL